MTNCVTGSSQVHLNIFGGRAVCITETFPDSSPLLLDSPDYVTFTVCGSAHIPNKAIKGCPLVGTESQFELEPY